MALWFVDWSIESTFANSQIPPLCFMKFITEDACEGLLCLKVVDGNTGYLRWHGHQLMNACCFIYFLYSMWSIVFYIFCDISLWQHKCIPLDIILFFVWFCFMFSSGIWWRISYCHCKSWAVVFAGWSVIICIWCDLFVGYGTGAFWDLWIGSHWYNSQIWCSCMIALVALKPGEYG